MTPISFVSFNLYSEFHCYIMFASKVIKKFCKGFDQDFWNFIEFRLVSGACEMLRCHRGVVLETPYRVMIHYLPLVHSAAHFVPFPAPNSLKCKKHCFYAVSFLHEDMLPSCFALLVYLKGLTFRTSENLKFCSLQVTFVNY